MNVEILKYFQYIAKYKNITQAAKHLYVSQSTLSRHIMALENELGVKLFERNNKLLTLTAAGIELLDSSDALIAHMNSLVKNVTAADKGHTGILKITAPKNLMPLLSDSLDIIHKHYPEVRFFVETYEFSEIHLAIRYGLYHIGFTYDFALSENENLECLPIVNEGFSIVYPAKYTENDSLATITNLVKSLPFIVPAYSDPPFLQNVLASLPVTTSYRIEQIIEVNTSDSMLLNVSLGLGYGLLPNSWGDLLSEDNRLGFITLPDINTARIVAVCRQNTSSKLVTTIFDLLKKNFN